MKEQELQQRWEISVNLFCLLEVGSTFSSTYGNNDNVRTWTVTEICWKNGSREPKAVTLDGDLTHRFTLAMFIKWGGFSKWT